MTALALKPLPAVAVDIEIELPSGIRLVSGDVLPDRVIRVRRFGPPDAPQIVALGGISAGRDVCGEIGWWRDTLERFVGDIGVIGLDFAPLGNERVRLCPHDQARLLALALDGLGIGKLHALIGASYGGMVGLAFAALTPERVERLCVISAAHKPAAQALAWRGVQRRVVEYGLTHDDGAGGLALARQLAMITYRTPEEFEARFGAGIGEDGRGAVDAYLEARGDDYARRTQPQRWLTLSEAIDRFQVQPADIGVATTLVACPSDQLAPLADIEALAAGLPRLRALHTLPSIYGHDAFLKEPARLGALIAQLLEEPIHG